MIDETKQPAFSKILDDAPNHWTYQLVNRQAGTSTKAAFQQIGMAIAILNPFNQTATYCHAVSHLSDTLTHNQNKKKRLNVPPNIHCSFLEKEPKRWPTLLESFGYRRERFPTR